MHLSVVSHLIPFDLRWSYYKSRLTVEYSILIVLRFSYTLTPHQHFMVFKYFCRLKRDGRLKIQLIRWRDDRLHTHTHTERERERERERGIHIHQKSAGSTLLYYKVGGGCTLVKSQHLQHSKLFCATAKIITNYKLQ